MVLHGGDEDLVSRFQIGVPERRGDEVHALRRPAHEQHLPRLLGAQEPPGLFAGAVVGSGGVLAQVVDAAMDVGVALFVIAREGVEDGARLLARRRVVEVHQGPAPHLESQRGELRPELRDVERGTGTCRRGDRRTDDRHMACCQLSMCSRSRTMRSSCVRTSGTPTRARISVPNPYVRSARAASAPSPRLRR